MVGPTLLLSGLTEGLVFCSRSIFPANQPMDKLQSQYTYYQGTVAGNALHYTYQQKYICKSLGFTQQLFAVSGKQFVWKGRGGNTCCGPGHSSHRGKATKQSYDLDPRTSRDRDIYGQTNTRFAWFNHRQGGPLHVPRERITKITVQYACGHINLVECVSLLGISCEVVCLYVVQLFIVLFVKASILV